MTQDQRRERTLADFRALHAEVGDPQIASRLLIAERIDELDWTVSNVSAVLEDLGRYSLDNLAVIANTAVSRSTTTTGKRRTRPPGSKNKPKPTTAP